MEEYVSNSGIFHAVWFDLISWFDFFIPLSGRISKTRFPKTIYVNTFTYAFINASSEIFWKIINSSLLFAFSIYTKIWHYIYKNIEWKVLSLFSPNAGKYGPEMLRIRTLFTKWELWKVLYEAHSKPCETCKMECFSFFLI